MYEDNYIAELELKISDQAIEIRELQHQIALLERKLEIAEEELDNRPV